MGRDYRLAPAFRMTPTASISNMSGFVTSLASSGSNIAAGTYYYYILPCMDFSGLFHGAMFVTPAVSFPVPAAYVRLDWSAQAKIPGVRAYKVYRAASATGVGSLIGTVDPDVRVFTDYNTTARGEQASYNLSNNTNAAQYLDLRQRPNGEFTHTKEPTLKDGFDRCEYSLPAHRRLFPDGHRAGDKQSVERILIREEEGARVALSLYFEFFIGNDEDDAIRQLYNCFLAYPESTEPGIKVECCLDYRAGGSYLASTWWECELIGEYDPQPVTEDRNGRVSLKWGIQKMNPQGGVPLAGTIADVATGRGTVV